MRLLTSIALPPLLAVALIAQTRLAIPSGVYRIHKLTLVSTDLPRAQEHTIVVAFQGGTYDLDELAERIRQKLRDSGYAFTEVGAPQVTRRRSVESACEADVRYSVHTGDQYRLGQITFTGGTVFTADQLRAQFESQDGAIFNATEIGKGLERLKNLYASAGYINFGAIPKPVYDNTRRTVTILIDIDQGLSFKFGTLFFEGIEPRAGIANMLLASWRNVEGKVYSPQILSDWLKSTASDWPPGTMQTAQLQTPQNPEQRLVNPVLYFQCGTYPVLCP